MMPENFPPESQAVPGRTEVQPSAVANPEGRQAGFRRTKGTQKRPEVPRKAGLHAWSLDVSCNFSLEKFLFLL